jgi:predicted amino acid dehydrogenase
MMEASDGDDRTVDRARAAEQRALEQMREAQEQGKRAVSGKPATLFSLARGRGE